jgi:mannosyl-3-phosphoglycerate phosphatase
MTDDEIMETAELSAEEASMAKDRYFDEPFFFSGDDRETQRLLESIERKGFNHTKGKFFHILGNSDKGKAVSILIDLYKRDFSEITTVAIGDSPNDITMLERVDYPAVVQKPDGSYDKQINISNLKRADGIGPEGWNKIILGLITKEFISKNI